MNNELKMYGRIVVILTILSIAIISIIMVEMYRYYYSYVEWSLTDEYNTVPPTAKKLLIGTIYTVVISYGYDLLMMIIFVAVLCLEKIVRQAITMLIALIYLFTWLGYSLAIRLAIQNLSSDEQVEWNSLDRISYFFQLFMTISLYRAIPFALMIYRDMFQAYCNL